MDTFGKINKPIALIPARGGSKRLPRKNILPLNGKPLLAYVLEMAENSGIFSKVYVSSEDQEIQEIGRKYGGEIIIRPVEMASDRSTMINVYEHAVNHLNLTEEQWVCILYPTAVLLTGKTLINSWSYLIDKLKSQKVSSLMGVSCYPYPPVQALIENKSGYLEYFLPEFKSIQSQFHPELCVSNGTFCWLHVKETLAEMTFYTENLLGFLVSDDEVCDIDYEEDYIRLVKLWNG